MNSNKNVPQLLYAIGVIAVMFFLVWNANKDEIVLEDEFSEQSMSKSDFHNYSVYVNSRNLNVRNRPSTESEVIGQLAYRDMIVIMELDSTKKWGKISKGWVFLSLTSKTMPPMLPDLEIVEMDVKYIDSEYGYTDYSWLVKVKNNSNSNRKFSCRVRFLDNDQFELDYDYGFDFYIKAGEEAVFSGKKSIKDNLAKLFKRYTMNLDY